ncbi:MAG TPA: alpha,alpha-trehalase TreF [Opitutaceae bacterium]
MEIFELGPLFEEVQRSAVFPDSKTFVDCLPRHGPERILAAYAQAKAAAGAAFDLPAFVREHFTAPRAATPDVPAGEDIEHHIATLWGILHRPPDKPVAGSSLLSLPHPYIVPGGRFREIYYWDSYFTMLGLRENGDEAMIQNMTDNFAHLIARFGHVPNGNRSYYLSRSQPPYLALMVELLAEKQGCDAYRRYRTPLLAEYAYWMDEIAATRHAVALDDGLVLNRYYDQLDTPRPEAFVEDEHLATRSAQPRATLFRHIRSAAESGWDFSTRWFADGATMETIETTEILPIDLNCLLHFLELILARAHEDTPVQQHRFRLAAARRAEAICRYGWCESARFFCDHRLVTGQPSERLSLAGVMPLFFKLATPGQAEAVMARIRDDFLKPGGVVTTLIHSGQQWDAPNGWAPLQWLTIRGLENYGCHSLAAEIARRWIKLNRDVYARTGKLMEKYNVVDPTLEAGGGEYPSQDGFGWTNGVLLKLLRGYPRV